MTEKPRFARGDPVEKTGGDYAIAGVVVAVFKKRSGAIRYVIEHDCGLLLILNEGQLRPKAP